ncbi:MAG: FAD-binding oxidoreductase [Planctomycetes bacterium]|nr:FAD-binding oxidoreductase [Planctomycetota bacterium]
MLTSTEKVARHLAGTLEGEVRTDTLTRGLYATDASLYEILPVAVVLPRSQEDVVRTVRFCAREGMAVLPRGGGTSLAGQTSGEAVVLDFTRHMDRVVSVDPAARTCVVEPGVVLSRLNAGLAPHGLKFAPDPASATQCVIGGMIGNNSTGCHSLVHDKTDGYLRMLDLVLADGSAVATGPVPWTGGAGVFGEIARTLHASRDLVESRYPRIHRNVSGYNLRGALSDGEFNPARLLAGSEGTLGIVTRATIALVRVPPCTETALLFYADLGEAMRDVPRLLESRPSVVELMDRTLFDLAARHPDYASIVAAFPASAAAALLVEWDGDAPDAPRAAADRVVRERSGSRGGCMDATRSTDPHQRKRWWTLRKSGLPLLASRASDAKHIEFVEDTAVPADRLAEYVEGFQGILRRHGTSASFWGHAGPGCLHVRPLIDVRGAPGRDTMRAIASEVADLAISHGGTISGEHGDGQSRSPFVRRLYGDGIADLFVSIKRALDPAGILNPGKVVTGETDIARNLRSFSSPGIPGPIDFGPQIDLSHAAELCHGCGGCRTREAGVMCPTFRATGEEIQSPRGRANLLRLALVGKIPDDEALRREAVDFCVGCKACARECPSGVDVARLRVAWRARWHERHGTPLRERAIAALPAWRGRPGWLRAAASGVSRLALARWAIDAFAGLTSRRPLPAMRRRTFASRLALTAVPERPSVFLWADCFTDLFDPEAGEAALEVLRSEGESPRVLTGLCCGRAAYSVGCVEEARAQARASSQALQGSTQPILFLEPSCATMVAQEWPSLGLQAVAQARDLLSSLASRGMSSRGAVELRPSDEGPVFAARATNTGPSGRGNHAPLGTTCEGSLLLHDHCHARAAGWGGKAEAALRARGIPAGTLGGSCCGMAGSFGYEKEHYDLSMAMGRSLAQGVPAGAAVAAAGFSCRTQLARILGREVLHPIRHLARRVS